MESASCSDGESVVQVLDRAGLEAGNKGFEAACAAIRIVASIAKSAQENGIQIKPKSRRETSIAKVRQFADRGFCISRAMVINSSHIGCE